MRLVAFIVILTTLFGGRLAQAQEIGVACLQSGSSRDTTNYCLKASLLLQRAQLQRLDEILQAINRMSERTVAAINATGVRTSQALEPVAQSLQAGGGEGSPGSYFYVDDLANVEGGFFDCPTGDCASDGQAVAAEICETLGFGDQHAFDFEDNAGGGPMKRMMWVACRR